MQKVVTALACLKWKGRKDWKSDWKSDILLCLKNLHKSSAAMKARECPDCQFHAVLIQDKHVETLKESDTVHIYTSLRSLDVFHVCVLSAHVDIIRGSAGRVLVRLATPSILHLRIGPVRGNQPTQLLLTLGVVS